MNTKNQIELKCDCEFSGEISFNDNSKSQDAVKLEYSLVGFKGQSYTSEHFVSFRTMFNQLKPTCPCCNAKLTLENLVRLKPIK